MNVLHYTLKKKWFGMELSGEKPEEYREITPYWCKRLGHAVKCPYNCTVSYNGIPADNWCSYFSEPCKRQLHRVGEQFDAVHARNGYAPTSPTFIRECLWISVGIGRPEWGAPDHHVFIIKLGKAL